MPPVPFRVAPRTCRRLKALGIVLGLAGLTAATTAIIRDLTLVAELHAPAVPAHLDQGELLTLVQRGRGHAAFDKAFTQGDRLFDAVFNALDGVGANVGQGQRFTRMPRADLTGPGEWANHVPSRTTGPNARGCVECHNEPVTDGAGGVAANVVRDPLHSGNVARMIHRSTPHTFGIGALQRLAEEMTDELHGIRGTLSALVRKSGTPASAPLVAKGVSFGTLTALPGKGPGSAVLDTSAVQGVNSDLIVRPLQWKGSVAFLRDFNRDAANNEIGMQAVELVGEGVDGDGDGVVDELTVGDITALTVYLAAQPRPVTKLELNELGLLPEPLTQTQIDQIGHGQQLFAQIGCAACHVPSLALADPVFREPSSNANFRDARFPSGMLPRAAGVRADLPVTFDLRTDQPMNVFVVNGQIVRLGGFRAGANGNGAVVEMYGDLKRHDLGPELAEAIDEAGTGASVFLTENLWGVGATAPYLHDGRATTLTEAILEHGGEGAPSRAAFRALTTQEQLDMLLFLDNLTLIKGGLPVGG
jgi:hypothetical protein